MTHDDYQRAANHWKEKDKFGVKMDKEALVTAVEDYIYKNNVCALATGTGDFVRCTPIEYAYHDGAFWMFSEGGEKFNALEHNKKVCLAIYNKYEGFGNLKGMQVMGIVDLVDYYSDEYMKAAEFKKIPIEALKKLSEPMNLLKVTPNRIDFLNSDFKKQGFASRQCLEY